MVATDVAVYAAGPARPAGGGGAVAMLVGPDAPLDLERGLAGAWMSDEWDFYKPAGCGLWPVVDGARSVAAYLRGLDACWAALCDKADARLAGVEEEAKARRRGSGGGGGGGGGGESGSGGESESPSSSRVKPFSLSDVDHVVMHAPYGKLLRKGFARMVAADERRRKARGEEGGARGGEAGRGQGGPQEEARGGEAARGRGAQDAAPRRRAVGPGPDFDERAAVEATAASFDAYVGPSCWLAAEVGNMYAASVHAGLAALVEARGKGQEARKAGGRSEGGGTPGGGGSGGGGCGDGDGDGRGGLEGARILVYSYGSGAAACLFSVTARRVGDPSRGFSLEALAASLRLSDALSRRRRATPEEFARALALAEARWGACDYAPSAEAIEAVAPGVWYLDSVDEKHRRRYERKPCLAAAAAAAEEEGEKRGASSSSSPPSSSSSPPPPHGILSGLAAGASADNLAADLLEKLSAG